jgi:hypothetical protein
MRLLILLSLFSGLFSCSGYYHAQKAKKHTDKALEKGVTVGRDTTTFTISDTITEIDTLDNYITITKTIRDSVFVEGKTVFIAKTRTEARQDGKTERTKIRNEAKLDKVQTKQRAKNKRKESRKPKKNYLFWIGLICGLSIRYIIPAIKNKI